MDRRSSFKHSSDGVEDVPFPVYAPIPGYGNGVATFFRFSCNLLNLFLWSLETRNQLEIVLPFRTFTVPVVLRGPAETLTNYHFPDLIQMVIPDGGGPTHSNSRWSNLLDGRASWRFSVLVQSVILPLVSDPQNQLGYFCTFEEYCSPREFSIVGKLAQTASKALARLRSKPEQVNILVDIIQCHRYHLAAYKLRFGG
jgi:hypothetical protein